MSRGLVLLTSPFAMPWNADSIPGLVFALVAVNGWALGAVLYRRRRWQSTYWQQTFWQLAVTAAVMIPFMIVLEDGGQVRLSASMLAITGWNSVVPTVIGYWCWAQALARLPAAAASQVLLLSPLFGMVLGSLVLDEPLGTWTWLAATCVILGAWLAISGPSRPNAKSE